MAKLVLIIDDDPAQRRVLAEIVGRLGYATKTAHGGAQALEVLGGLDQGSIALVLLDLVMPGMDGMDVLRRIALASGGPPVIVQTANGSLDAAKAAMRAGAVDFLVKPTSAERLEVSIRSALKIEALQGEISRIKRKAEGTLTFADLVLRAEAMHSGWWLLVGVRRRRTFRS
jgi:DNA-binding NtrC family response regulator